MSVTTLDNLHGEIVHATMQCLLMQEDPMNRLIAVLIVLCVTPILLLSQVTRTVLGSASGATINFGFPCTA